VKDVNLQPNSDSLLEADKSYVHPAG